MAEGGAARAPHRPRGGRRGAGGGAGLAAGSGGRAALAGAHEEVSWRPRNSARGGWGSGCGHRTEPEPRLYTLCPRQASDTPWLQTAFTSSGRSTSHRAPPGPLSAAQQQQAVRGQGTVCAALTCAVRASTRAMATQLTLDDRGGELQAAHTVPQRRGHGAPKAAPQA